MFQDVAKKLNLKIAKKMIANEEEKKRIEAEIEAKQAEKEAAKLESGK